jgi:hypothetical protein
MLIKIEADQKPDQNNRVQETTYASVIKTEDGSRTHVSSSMRSLPTSAERLTAFQ